MHTFVSMQARHQVEHGFSAIGEGGPFGDAQVLDVTTLAAANSQTGQGSSSPIHESSERRATPTAPIHTLPPLKTAQTELP